MTGGSFSSAAKAFCANSFDWTTRDAVNFHIATPKPALIIKKAPQAAPITAILTSRPNPARRIFGVVGSAKSGFAFWATGVRALPTLIPSDGSDLGRGGFVDTLGEVGMGSGAAVGAETETVTGFTAANDCMQIKHSTDVPAAISVPKLSVEPQWGHANWVLCMGISLLARQIGTAAL